MSCCNTSPCTPSTGNPCPSYPNTDCVVYSGGLLPCLGVFSNERLTDILEKIDAKLCAVPRQRYIFENALTESPDYTVHLGGSLIENTTITLSTHSLTVTADPGNSFILPANGTIVFPRLPNTQDFILTTDANGVVILTDPQTFFNPPLYTFVNGLSETGFVAKLGGPLIEGTNIDFAGFNLSFSNVPPGTPSSILGIDGSGNIITTSEVVGQRFGIEDTTGVQNRSFDFDGFNFAFLNPPSGSVNVTLGLDVDGNIITFNPTSVWKTILSVSYALNTVTALTTFYGQITGRAAFVTDETSIQYVISEDCSIDHLFVVTGGTQPVSGSLVVTVRKNLTDTLLSITVPAGAAAGTFADITNIIPLTAGDTIDYQLINNSSSTSCPMVSVGTVLFNNG